MQLNAWACPSAKQYDDHPIIVLSHTCKFTNVLRICVDQSQWFFKNYTWFVWDFAYRQLHHFTFIVSKCQHYGGKDCSQNVQLLEIFLLQQMKKWWMMPLFGHQLCCLAAVHELAHSWHPCLCLAELGNKLAQICQMLAGLAPRWTPDMLSGGAVHTFIFQRNHSQPKLQR